jgi:predicted nucleotidyltransferase
MLLNDSTFEKLFAASVTKSMGETKVRVPCVEHLVALKVHALKHARTRRFLKDFQDVTELVLRNRIDLASAEIHEIFQRYGTPELYEKVRSACAKERGS